MRRDRSVLQQSISSKEGIVSMYYNAELFSVWLCECLYLQKPIKAPNAEAIIGMVLQGVLVYDINHRTNNVGGVTGNSIQQGLQPTWFHWSMIVLVMWKNSGAFLLARLAQTWCAFTMRIQVSEDVPSRGPGPSQPGADQTNPLLLPDYLYNGKLWHVVVQLILQMGCKGRRRKGKKFCKISHAWRHFQKNPFTN